MAKGRVEFEKSRCKGCGLCVAVCPKEVIEINTEILNSKGYAPAIAKRMDDCIACQNCAITCPDSIIKVYKIS